MEHYLFMQQNVQHSVQNPPERVKYPQTGVFSDLSKWLPCIFKIPPILGGSWPQIEILRQHLACNRGVVASQKWSQIFDLRR